MLDLKIQPDALRRVGLKSIELITIRTLAGRDANNAPFAPYSTEPFARPLGGITARARAALGETGLKIFKTRGGHLWAVITGGYRALKAASNPQDGPAVNMSATGAMLRALTIINVNAGARTVSIGFSRGEEAIKAYWHNVTGVGRQHTIRKFMGVAPSEQPTLAAIAAEGITIKT
ncbi:MAG: hypothetical protein ABI876_03470 [Bacteroidota bacterium]